MKHEGDRKAAEQPLIKGKPGRPRMRDALTPAERAKRYREKRKKAFQAEKEQQSATNDTTVDDLHEKLCRLQMRYDLEHLTVTQMEAELAALRQVLRRPTVNPLAKEVSALKKVVAEQERMLSAYSAEINRLRDELKSSQKSKR